VRLSPLGTSVTIWPIVPAPDDDDECGAVGGMRTGRGNRSTQRRPAPVPLRTPQIPHDLTWARTRDRPGGNPGTNRLSYGMANSSTKSITQHIFGGRNFETVSNTQKNSHRCININTESVDMCMTYLHTKLTCLIPTIYQTAS
jgi:hypothetical protein